MFGLYRKPILFSILKIALVCALAILPQIGFADTLSASPCTALLEKVVTTAELKQSYQKIETERYWNKWIDNEADFRRFISKQSYEALKDKMHPVDMYGEKNYLAWKNANDYLENIPKGKLDLSIELFSDVHRIASEDLSNSLKLLKYIIPAGYIPTQGGVLKKRISVGKDPVFTPLTETQYKTIKNNPWLNGFFEIPLLSKPDKRRGYIVYAKPSETRTKLEKLIEWYRENKDSMDPIELATRFQQAFVSIHPFIDGNGRTSRLIMDRILAEYGLPPPLLDSHLDDIYLSPEEYTEQVRKGIQTYLDVDKKLYYPTNPPLFSHTNAGGRGGIGFGIRPFNDSKTAAKHPEKMNIGKWGEGEILLGGKRFIFYQDGFFYSNHGIPYVYHAGALYPISDASFALYFSRLANYGEKTRLTNGQKEVYRSHFNLLREIRETKTDPDKIKIIPYSTVENSNNKNELFLHDWQKAVFLEAIKIETTDPFSTLSRSRAPQTNFEERSRFTNNKPSFAQVLAQYEAMDLKFWKHEQYAKKHLPEALPEIRKSREKLWAAGRELIKEFLEDRNTLSAEDRKNLEKMAIFHLWDSYFAESKLSYPTYEEALRKTDDNKITLLRSDDGAAKYIGFHSQQDYKSYLNAIPGATRLKNFLTGLQSYMENPDNQKHIQERIKVWQGRMDANEKLISLLPKSIQKMAKDIHATYGKFSQLLRLILERVYGSKYKSRGTSAEYQRTFVDFLLHARGSSPNKVGTSYTTSLELLTPNPDGELAFSSGGFNSSLFIVKAPKSNVEWNMSSDFSSEYEVIGMKPTYPWSIQERFAGTALASGRPDGLTPKAEEFLTKYRIGKNEKALTQRKLNELSEALAKATKQYHAVTFNSNATPEEKAKASEMLQKLNQQYQKDVSAITNPIN